MTGDQQVLQQPAAEMDWHAAAAGDGGQRRRRRWPRRLAALTGVGVVAAGAWYMGTVGGGGAAPAATTVATATAEVVRTDLTRTEDVQGTLGYADPVTLAGQGGAQGQGTVTWLAPEGRTVRRGESLYEVDARPVPLMYGSRPMWRPLREGDVGPDVRQLEGNLAELGFDPDGEMTVDEEFTAATTAAVERWQADRGVEETGVVELGEVVFLPNEVRVGAHRTQPPAPAQGELMDVTSTARVVEVGLPTSRQANVSQDDTVTVELPDGSTTSGRVTEVGSVAQAAQPAGDEQQQGGGGGEGQEEATIKVEVTLDNPQDAGALDQAPVQVAITTDSREGVLAVPVHALVALAEGGYAVEVDQEGARSLVPVETGLFTDDLVEVSGEGLTEGTQVVVPA